MAPTLGCGGQSAATGTDAGDAVSDASSDAVVEAAADAPLPARICTSDRDCLAVLDYRSGFECWAPTAASTADVSQDACLIPWKPNAQCTTALPPPGCPSGSIPVQHSCIVTPCATASCNEGTCMLTFGSGSECAVVDAGPPDCAALQSAYVQAATAAQQCDPTPDAAACAGEYPDSCGCEAAFSLSGRPGTALNCAFQAIEDAHCAFPTCTAETTCPTVPNSGAATCVANESGTSGTCAWVN